MQGYVVLVALCGLAAGAPQNWPYRDSLMPYRYGYPNQQAQYKYLPQMEDDEGEVGPYFQDPQARREFVVGSDGQGRQEFVVGSDGDRVIPTLPPPSVVETGSVAPVIEQNRIPTTAVPPPTKAPTPPPPKPLGGSPNKPVQPVRPAFPPARPPPPPKREKEVEEDEDEDDDESEEDDDADDQNDDGDEDDDNEEEEEDDRRRQEPLSKEEPEKEAQVVKVVEKETKKKEKVPVVKTETKKVKNQAKQQQSSAVEPPAPVVVPAPKPTEVKTVVKSQSSNTKVPTTSAVDDNEDKPVVDSNEVVKPNGEADDESSEEQGLGDDGVEALVPGYVTEQGEILVPVDTVSGNQPISIVPDPYTPPTRGVPLRQHHTQQQQVNYRSPYEYYYPEVYPGIGRQVKSEDSEEVEETQDDDNTSVAENDSTENSAESDDETSNQQPGRNEFVHTAFPPSRSPEFYAVIKSRIPVSSSEEQYQYAPEQMQMLQGYQGQGYQGQRQGPYSYGGPQPQRRPVYFRRRPQQQPQQQQVSLAVAISNSNEAQSQQPQQQYVRRPSPFAPAPYPVYSGFNRYPEPYSAPYLRNPYGYYKVPVYRPQHPPSPYAQSQRRPLPPVSPFYARPAVGPAGQPQGFRPRPIYKKPPVNYNQYNYNYGGFGASSGQFTPVLIRKNPGWVHGGVGTGKKPVSFSNKRPSNKPVRKPTPVTYQDDEPYPFQQPFPYYTVVPDTSSGSDENNSFQQSQEGDSSSVEGPKIIQGGTTRQTATSNATGKSRRAAKMTKSKFDKKNSMKQKKVSDSDPLNILKKISTKRS